MAEEQKIPDRLKIESQSAYQNVRKLNSFDFLEHTYEGSHGYRDSSYLIPHPREVFYETRRSASYYVNVFASVINAMVEAVFENEITRTADNAMFQSFLQNTDAVGSTMQDIIEDAMYLARLLDVVFVVMDNYPKEQHPAVVGEAVEKRIYPFAYIKKPQEVRTYKEDSDGKLISIDFYDEVIPIKSTEDGKTIERQTYRRWTTTEWLHYYMVGKNEVQIAMGLHGLGVLPVIPVVDFSRRKRLSKIMKSVPSMYNLAFLCFALFNKESEIVSLEMNQCFSIFYVSGRLNTTVIGHSNVLEVPLDAKFPPGYTSPNPSMMEGLVKNSDRLTESIYRNARQKGVVALVEQSGIAKQWDFRGEESTLKRTATAAEKLEKNIALLFQLYTNQRFDYDPDYPEQFSPTYQKDLVERNITIIKEMPPKPLADRLWKQLGTQLFKNDKDLEMEMDDAADSGAGKGQEETE